MKILLTSDWYTGAVNGVVTSLLNLRRGLEERGHEVRILTLSPTAHSWSADGVTYIGSVNVGIVYPGARLRTALGGAFLRELMAWCPDVVHSNCEFSTFFMARHIAERLHIPLIHTYHTVYENYTHYFCPSEGLGQQLAGKFSRWIAGYTDCIIVPTEKVSRLLMNYGVTTPIRVIPTGIEQSNFTATREEGLAIRASLGIPEETTVMVSVGRLAKEKNCGELLHLLSNLQDLPVLLLLVGDGPVRNELEKKARELGVADRVIFTGMVPPEEVGRYYQVGDIFVSASTSETQGLTYFEALSVGLPMLCRADACLEGVVVDHKNGWQYHTEAEAAVRIRQFLAHPELRESMGSAALEVGRRYSVPSFAEHVDEVYQEQILLRQMALRGISA